LELAKESAEHQEGDDTTLLAGKVAGEYTTLKDKIIHLLLAREEKTNGQSEKITEKTLNPARDLLIGCSQIVL
jgi:hypothetical protein